MKKWLLGIKGFRSRWFSFYVARLRPDEEMHSHPWCYFRWILKGRFIERVCYHQRQHPCLDKIMGFYRDRCPAFSFSLGHWRHRILAAHDCWALFITGPVYREGVDHA